MPKNMEEVKGNGDIIIRANIARPLAVRIQIRPAFILDTNEEPINVKIKPRGPDIPQILAMVKPAGSSVSQYASAISLYPVTIKQATTTPYTKNKTPTPIIVVPAIFRFRPDSRIKVLSFCMAFNLLNS
jgi:hypothetical protein